MPAQEFIHPPSPSTEKSNDLLVGGLLPAVNLVEILVADGDGVGQGDPALGLEVGLGLGHLVQEGLDVDDGELDLGLGRVVLLGGLPSAEGGGAAHDGVVGDGEGGALGVRLLGGLLVADPVEAGISFLLAPSLFWFEEAVAGNRMG